MPKTSEELKAYHHQYYLDHGGKDRTRRPKGYIQPDHSSYRVEQENRPKVAVLCLGPLCCGKDKMFMSPDPKHIRKCEACNRLTSSMRTTRARAML